jgi:hypothetical protein
MPYMSGKLKLIKKNNNTVLHQTNILITEFSDEELGIPPDDAPDPEPDQYWGRHSKPFRTYR